MPLTVSRTVPSYEREVDQIIRTLRERGATGRSELRRAVGARQWGPGRYSASLRVAQEQGRARRLTRARYEAAGRTDEAAAASPGAREGRDRGNPKAGDGGDQGHDTVVSTNAVRESG